MKHALKSTQEQPTHQINWPSPVLAAPVAAVVAIIVLIKGRSIRYNQREINKRYINPLILKFAGHRWSPHAVIFHKGRKSGRSYTTPVVIEPATDGFMIPLPYGTDVDWCRNILAAGQCTIQWHGKRYTVVEPVLVNGEQVIAEVASMHQKIFRMIGVKQVIKVRIAPNMPESVAREETAGVLS